MTATDLSVQLYTVREALAEDFDGTLGRLAAFGYCAVEPFAYDRFAVELRSGLSRHGLAAPTAHVGLLQGDQAALFGLAVELGIGTVIQPRTDPGRWRSAADIRQIAGELNAAADRGAAVGVTVGYHNHHFEFESVEGRFGLEVLADALAPGVVLEVDTYWAYAGGVDVPALLERLGDRVVALHVKDGDGTLDTTQQTPVGAGSLPVWSFLDAAPDALRVVELDGCESGDLVDAVDLSRHYLLAGEAA